VTAPRKAPAPPAPARRRGRPRRQQEAQEELLAAAAALLARRHNVSMRELARSTGQSLANFYNYFRSKDDLLFALQRRAFENLVAAGEEAARAGVPEERLYAFIHNHVRYFTSHPDVMRVLVHEAGALPAARRRVVRALKERYFALGLELVRAVLDEGCANPAAAAAGPLDPPELERATYSLFGMLNWVYAWYDPRRHGGPTEVARTIHGLALCGLVARCPNRRIQARTERAAESLRVASPLHVLVTTVAGVRS
jgi:AcrR family transcriptional regulator